MMYLCRMVNGENEVYYGEGINPESALKDAASNSDCTPATCNEFGGITFWKMEKTKIKVSFEPTFFDE